MIPFAFLHMALDRRKLRNFSGIAFAKLLGCGKGETFTPSDVDITRWGFVATIKEDALESLDTSHIVSRWRSRSTSEFRAVLDPISSHGLWAKEEPFQIGANIAAVGQIAAITRARIAPRHTLRFFKSVPPVTQSLHASKGLISAIGIGEAPIGLQGTFSLWESAADLREFAYKGQSHVKAIADTSKYNWYSEELFARFSVRETRGSITR
ncbi:unannotated protein [freshwater metagenome]|uniref:Unannotated protein n=1 Tax=freshwater metagenome TaxID=449393 RepID=A0A6J7XQX5_9ZZZZ